MTTGASIPNDGELLFVYAADSGLFNTVTDIAHKIFSPDTYACDLCALTHGYFSVRGEWRAFVESLGMPCTFRHRDEAVALDGVDAEQLPAVFRSSGGRWACCLDRHAIAACAELEQLKLAISAGCAGEGADT